MLLICLCCISLDVVKRLKMGQIIHMLEVDDVAFRYEILTLKEKDNVSSSADVLSKRVPYESKYPKSIRKSI
ncbi:hypothetical protein AHAS_Ahas15G0252200 [Arachis hypogaea]